MKLTIIFLILLLNISIGAESLLDDYSINKFKDYLEENGLFKLIESIKACYGVDVAIISCEELNNAHGGNCNKLVREYMPVYITNGTISFFNKMFKNSCKMPLIKKQIDKMFNLEKSKSIYEQIRKRSNESSLCFKK